MHVYIVQAGTKKNSPVKIGMSDDPKKRIKQLQTGNPSVLRLLISIKCESRKHALELEKTLHRMLLNKNILNEWFRVKQKSLFDTINRFANNPDIEQVKSHVDMFSRDDKKIKIKPIAKKKNTNNNVDHDANRRRNLAIKNNNKDKAIFDMERKLIQRKSEARIFRSKLIELGFKGCFDELLGRVKL